MLPRLSGCASRRAGSGVASGQLGPRGPLRRRLGVRTPPAFYLSCRDRCRASRRRRPRYPARPPQASAARLGDEPRAPTERLRLRAPVTAAEERPPPLGDGAGRRLSTGMSWPRRRLLRD